MVYSAEQTSLLAQHQFAFIKCELHNHVFTLTLNRPARKNALHPVMLNEMAFALAHAHFNKDVWAVVIRAEGNVFCAGADLKAFVNSEEEIASTVPAPSEEIIIAELCNTVHKPCIAKVEGNVYAGGVLILATCNYVVANKDVLISLPEVKRGLFPFQVMSSLLEIMNYRDVMDWCMRGNAVDAAQAKDWGLVTHIAESNNAQTIIDELLAEIFENAPTAIKLGLEAYHHIKAYNTKQQHIYLKSLLAKTLQTQDAQEGIRAFAEKRKPKWTGE